MKASETKFQPIVEGTKQYLVPLFQRAYSWTQKEWEVLWEDLLYLAENERPRTHFIGSIVTMQAISVPEGVNKFLLIDGQQRLTTIFILITLLRDEAKRTDEELANELQQTMLVNPFKKGDDYYKLLPTQTDRQPYYHLIKGEDLRGESLLFECYRFFSRKLKQTDQDIRTLSTVLTSRLTVVSIALGTDDDPHLVFESLNAKGRELTKADLIKNYFFMKIHIDQQQEMYDRYWAPMQNELGEDLTEFIRHFLMRKGDMVKQSDVYFALKESVENREAMEALGELAAWAVHYGKLLQPSREQHSAIRQALTRLNRIEVSTAYPFLLNCYDAYAEEQLSADEFSHILSTLENYVLRRFVCNIPPNSLNRIFSNLYQNARLRSSTSLREGVCLDLQDRGYPKDGEFTMRLREARLYGRGQRQVKTKIILESLESAHAHKEQVPYADLTIEHVMPRTVTEWWQEHLGDDWQTDHEMLLHTLGNLTLTAYNSEASNAPFPNKRQIFNDSHLEINKYVGQQSSWCKSEIEERAKALAEQALLIWPYFGREDSQDAAEEEDVTGQTPKVLTILGQHMNVSSWRDVMSMTLTTVADLEPELFQQLAAEYPRFLGTDSSPFRTARALSGGYYCEVNLSAKDVYRFCRQAIESVELSMEDWAVEYR